MKGMSWCITSPFFSFFSRIIQNKIIMAVICLVILGAIGFVIYYAVK